MIYRVLQRNDTLHRYRIYSNKRHLSNKYPPLLLNFGYICLNFVPKTPSLGLESAWNAMKHIKHLGTGQKQLLAVIYFYVFF